APAAADAAEATSRLIFAQADGGIRDFHVTGVQTCALPISQHAEGIRTDPPVSLPNAMSASSLATATAEPLDDPPGMRFASMGLRSEERRVGKERSSRWRPSR